MDTKQIRDDIFDAIARTRNEVLFADTIDCYALNCLYDDIIIELEQLLIEAKKHLLYDVYYLIYQMIHDLDKKNRKQTYGQITMPHKDFFTSPIYSCKELQKNKFKIFQKNYRGYLLKNNGEFKEINYHSINDIYNMNVLINTPNIVKFYPLWNDYGGFICYGLTSNHEICDIPYSMESLKFLIKLKKIMI